MYRGQFPKPVDLVDLRPTYCAPLKNGIRSSRRSSLRLNQSEPSPQTTLGQDNSGWELSRLGACVQYGDPSAPFSSRYAPVDRVRD